MMMLLVDGGKIIDYTAEEGYYTVKNDLAPSMFNGSLKDAISETFNRFKFGGVTPQNNKFSISICRKSKESASDFFSIKLF